MFCPTCQNPARRFGFNRNGSQRYRCAECGTFTDPQSRPADNRRLPLGRAVDVLRQLLEGNSLRSTHRLTSVARNTIVGTMVEAGTYCKLFLDDLRGLPAADVQADELWAFVGCKEKTRLRLGRGQEYGDVWCFLAIERNTKMILAHHVGKRTPDDALEFTEKLRRATRPARFQLSTDGFTPYPGTVDAVFGPNIDYGQIVKVFGPTAERGTAGRYSPGQILSVDRTAVIGNPDQDRICTSHRERQTRRCACRFVGTRDLRMGIVRSGRTMKRPLRFTSRTSISAAFTLLSRRRRQRRLASRIMFGQLPNC